MKRAPTSLRAQLRRLRDHRAGQILSLIAMTTFYAFPYDVTYQIINILHTEDHSSLQRLSATCRRMRHEAIPIMFASIYFSGDASWNFMDEIQTRIIALLTNPLILASIRRFYMRVDDGTELHLLMLSLFHLIASTSELDELFIDAPKGYAARLRVALSPLVETLTEFEGGGIPDQLVAAPMHPKPFDPSTYRLSSVKKLVLDSWEWCFLADYCPEMQSLEVWQDSSVHYTNQHQQAESCFEVDIAHLAVTHPYLRRLHLKDEASVEVVSGESHHASLVSLTYRPVALAKYMPNIEELGFHSRTTPSTHDLTQFISFGKLHTLCLPSISDLRGAPTWSEIEIVCNSCREELILERRESAIDIIDALQNHIVSLREVQFGRRDRREVYQRVADGDFAHIKTLSKQYYHTLKDDITPVNPPSTKAPDRKGKGKAPDTFGTSAISEISPRIYASSRERRAYSPRLYAYSRCCRRNFRRSRSRSRSYVVMFVPPVLPTLQRTRNTVVVKEDRREARPTCSATGTLLTPFRQFPLLDSHALPPQTSTPFEQLTRPSPSRARPSSWIGRLANHFRSKKQGRTEQSEMTREVFPPQARIFVRRHGPRRSWTLSDLITSIYPPRSLGVTGGHQRSTAEVDLDEGGSNIPFPYRRSSLSQLSRSSSPISSPLRSRSPVVALATRRYYRRGSPSPSFRYRPGYGVFANTGRRAFRSRPPSPVLIMIPNPPRFRPVQVKISRRSPPINNGRRSLSRSSAINVGRRRSRSRSSSSSIIIGRQSRSPVLVPSRRSRSRSPVRRYYSRASSQRSRSHSSSFRPSESPTGYRNIRAESRSPSRGRSLRRFNASPSRGRSPFRAALAGQRPTSCQRDEIGRGRSVSR